ENAPVNPSPEAQIHAAAEDCTEAVARVQRTGLELIQPNHRMREEVRILSSPHKTWPNREGNFMPDVMPVTACIERQSEKLAEVARCRTAQPFCHARQILSPSQRIRGRGGHGCAWIEPLVSNENISLRSLFLRVGTTRQREQTKNQ